MSQGPTNPGKDPVGLKNVAQAPVNPATEDTLQIINTTTASIDTRLSTAIQTEGTTYAGRAGILGHGSVTTGAPTFTDGKEYPLSLDTAGNLRVATGAIKTSAQQSQIPAIVSTTAVLLIPNNTGRFGFDIVNNGLGDLYISYASSVATSGIFMGLKVVPGGCYSHLGEGTYVGDIYGIYSEVSISYNVFAVQYATAFS